MDWCYNAESEFLDTLSYVLFGMAFWQHKGMYMRCARPQTVRLENMLKTEAIHDIDWTMCFSDLNQFKYILDKR